MVLCSSKRLDTNPVEDPDPHKSERSDPDPHQRERSDPDPHKSGKVDSNPQKNSPSKWKGWSGSASKSKAGSGSAPRWCGSATLLSSVQYRKVQCAGIIEQSMGASRNRVGIGLSYRPARLHRLAESIPGLLKTVPDLDGRMERGEELPVLILHYLQQRVVEDVPSLHQHFRQQLTPGTLPYIPPTEEERWVLVLCLNGNGLRDGIKIFWQQSTVLVANK